MNVRAITVCVNFADTLCVALPSIMQHVKHLVVATTPDDKETHKLIRKVDRAVIYRTEAFYENGADFNKGLVIEKTLDILGRTGWILVLDADIMLPAKMDLTNILDGCLYSPYRRILADPKAAIPVESDWSKLPHGPEPHNGEFAGYFQLFHANDAVLLNRPWYPCHCPTAGGCDSEFWRKWRAERRIRPPFEVLHLGQPGQHWRGKELPASRVNHPPTRKAEKSC